MRVFLPFPPSANDRLTRPRDRKDFVNTQRYRAWKQEAAWIVAMAIRAGEKRIPGTYQIDIVANPPDRRWRDLGNLEKAISDALKDGGAIDDDRFCQAQWIIWGRLDEPGVRIEVTPCPNLLSPEAGSDSLPSATVKSPIPRRSRRAATTQAATHGAASATGPRGSPVLVSRRSSTPAENIACPKTTRKPKT